MLESNIYPEVIIRNKEERRLYQGHLWIFSNELVKIRKDLEPGAVVRLVREVDHAALGIGFYHPNSLIAARVVSRDPSSILDEEFLRKRIIESAERRARLLLKRNAVRLVHGESDFLPGLIVDKFNDIISIQITSAGMERFKAPIVEIIRELFSPVTVVEKNMSSLRKLEGLPLSEQVLFGDRTVTEIRDSEQTRFSIDVLGGQKTGFFLDQMENRTTARQYLTPGDSVLDLFSNDGGFALNLALAGASQVTAVDSSAGALQRASANAELNGVSKIVRPVESDCFEYLQKNESLYDLVVLDPPALIRSKKDISNGRRAYLQLNLNAMKATRKDGVLITASCSHHMDRQTFGEMILEASRKLRRPISILEERGAGIDHPRLAAMPETQYLKVYYLRIH